MCTCVLVNVLIVVRKDLTQSTFRKVGSIWLMVLGASPSWQREFQPAGPIVSAVRKMAVFGLLCRFYSMGDPSLWDGTT